MSARKPERSPRSAPTSWGWHRLESEWSDRIVAAAGVRRDEKIIEVGAGAGVLTAALVAAGARVLAVELHPGRAAQLRARFADDPVTVLEADLRDVQWPRQPFRVLANPPFALTSALLRTLLQQGSALRRADLVLQRAVVQRYVDGTVRLPRGVAASCTLRLPRAAFRPRPSVDCAVLTLRRELPRTGRRRRPDP